MTQGLTGGITTTTSSYYYIEIDGLTDLFIKSMAQVSYEGKVSGAQKAIASGKFARSLRQTTSGGYESNPSMNIEVYMSADPRSASVKLYNWFQQCLPASNGGQANWANSRKTGSIVVYDPSGKEVLRWNFQKAWIKKYSITDPDVTGQDLAVETYEIVAERIDKVKSMSGGGVTYGAIAGR